MIESSWQPDNLVLPIPLIFYTRYDYHHRVIPSYGYEIAALFCKHNRHIIRFSDENRESWYAVPNNCANIPDEIKVNQNGKVPQ